MLDILQFIFWSVTYVLIIIAGYLSDGEKKVSMPYSAGVLNFAWEICALYNSGGLWGHAVWLGLDIVIVFWGFRFLKTNKVRFIYAASIAVFTSILFYIFTLSNGMLISVFIIDLIMAVSFLVDRVKLSPKLKVPIAFTKLLGDMFAGLHYAPYCAFVGILAGIILICNLYYLYLCIKEKTR